MTKLLEIDRSKILCLSEAAELATRSATADSDNFRRGTVHSRER
jgi:hypothetical protein